MRDRTSETKQVKHCESFRRKNVRELLMTLIQTAHLHYPQAITERRQASETNGITKTSQQKGAIKRGALDTGNRHARPCTPMWTNSMSPFRNGSKKYQRLSLHAQNFTFLWSFGSTPTPSPLLLAPPPLLSTTGTLPRGGGRKGLGEGQDGQWWLMLGV